MIYAIIIQSDHLREGAPVPAPGGALSKRGCSLEGAAPCILFYISMRTGVRGHLREGTGAPSPGGAFPQ